MGLTAVVFIGSLWTIFGSIAVTVCAAMLVAAGRAVARACKALAPTLRAIRDLTAVWRDALSVRDTTLAMRDDLEQIQLQLGTFDRPRGATPLERYLHAWRHDQANTDTKILLSVEANAAVVERLHHAVGELDDLIDRIEATTK